MQYNVMCMQGATRYMTGCDEVYDRVRCRHLGSIEISSLPLKLDGMKLDQYMSGLIVHGTI